MSARIPSNLLKAHNRLGGILSDISTEDAEPAKPVARMSSKHYSEST